MVKSPNKEPRPGSSSFTYRTFFVFSFLILCCCFPLHAKINFSTPDISEDNQVLFKAFSSGGGAPDQSALFFARLPVPGGTSPSGTRVLSAFPEHMDLIENGRTLQIRNAFGTIRVPVTGGLPRHVPGISALAEGNHAAGGRTEKSAVSPDGRWLLYLETVSAAYGRLILTDTVSGRKTEVSPRVEKPEETFPASWSPNSRYFVYSRGERLYYCSVSNIPADERFRLIGEGSINSVCWSREGLFYYFRGSSLYQVRETDLFTRALYIDFLELGKPAGNIPFEFNPAQDRFWMAPDARSILVSRSKNNIFYFSLDSGDSGRSGNASLPYLGISQSCLDINVLWPLGGTITVLVSAASGAENSINLLAYRLDTTANSGFFTRLPDEGHIHYRGADISPDGTKVLFWGEQGISIYDYANWKPLAVSGGRNVRSGLWNGNDEVIAGDDFKIESVRLTGSGAISRRDLICLSQVEIYGFESRNVSASFEDGPLVLARSGGAVFVTDGVNRWVEVPNAALRSASQTSALFRVYLDEQGAGPFENLPMVRNLSSVGTFPLIPGTSPQFTNRKTASLCIDLYDDDTGLNEVLNVLDTFGFRATFFLGGEFIRRFPESAKEIAVRGHETASLFFTPINLTDERYRVTGEFITQGLARNEDEFFKAAGRELALIWHPPHYASTREIDSAAARAGYFTVNRDIDPLDWVSREDEVRLGLPLYPSADIIDRIMSEAKNGAIIPVHIGLLPGRRDYLFNRLSVLLDALIRENYTIVTVSQLLKE